MKVSMFKNRFLFAGLGFTLVTCVISYVLGNPQIGSSVIPWHWVPEIASIFVFLSDLGSKIDYIFSGC